MLKEKGFDFSKGLKNSNLTELVIKKDFSAENILFLAKENQKFSLDQQPKDDIFILMSDLLYRDKNTKIINELNILHTHFNKLNILDAICHNFMRKDTSYNDKIIFTFDNFNKFNCILNEVLKENIPLEKEIFDYKYYSYQRLSYGYKYLKSSNEKIEIADNQQNKKNNFIFFLIQHINFFINNKDYEFMKKNVNILPVEIESIRNKSFQLLKQVFKKTDLQDIKYIIYNVSDAFEGNKNYLKELLSLMVNNNLTINCTEFNIILEKTGLAFHNNLLEQYFLKNEMNIVDYFKEKLSLMSYSESKDERHLIKIFDRLPVEKLILLKEFLENPLQSKNSTNKTQGEEFHELIKQKVNERFIEHEKEMLFNLTKNVSLKAKTNRI